MDGGEQRDSDIHGKGYALGRTDRPWTEAERAEKEMAVRDIVPDFDERGGSVKIGSQPGANIDAKHWLHIRFEVPIPEASQFAMLYWLDVEDMRLG
jgi:hypothetical protein